MFYISLGMSLRLVSRTLQVKNILSYIGGFNTIMQGLVSHFVYAVESTHIKHILIFVCNNRCWDNSVAFYAATNKNDIYLEVFL